LKEKTPNHSIKEQALKLLIFNLNASSLILPLIDETDIGEELNHSTLVRLNDNNHHKRFNIREN